MDDNPQAQWTELTVQQLVRYEALFKLLDEIQLHEDNAEISRRVAMQWKYFANVSSWRMVIANGDQFRVIDGFRGEAQIDDVRLLSLWDEHHWAEQRSCLIDMAEPLSGPVPPEHLTGKAVTEIKVLPFLRAGRCIGLLSVAGRHVPFSELDSKFIRLFGGHFADRISDILLRKQAMDALVAKATRDALTGLLNRGAIIEQLESQLALSRRTGEPLGLILADIDFFKVINDSLGHLAGDEVLRESARRMQAQARDGDSVGRYGGEEFLFVLYPCNTDEATKAAERFRHAMAATDFDINGDLQKSVTVSLGATTTDGQDAPTAQGLLKQADDALYRSKAEGRNRVTASNELDSPCAGHNL